MDAMTKEGHFTHNNTQAPKTKKVLPLFSLKGKTAIVSGAAAGIGLTVAEAFAEAGANVVLWYNSNKEANQRASDIEKEYGVKSKAYQVDIMDVDAVEKAVEEATKEFNGRLDIFVANSGAQWTAPDMLSGDVKLYRTVMATNLDGTYYCARAVGKVWKRQHDEGTDSNGNKLPENYTGGSFVCTASMSGHIVNIPQLQAAYNTTKAGLIQLCRSLAVEWVKFARVNSISPGYILTAASSFVKKEMRDAWKDKIPMGREAEPHELKGAFLYLASDASSYTTGTDIIVDGGYCCP